MTNYESQIATIENSIIDEFNSFDLIETDFRAIMRSMLPIIDDSDLDDDDCETIDDMIFNFARSIAISINARDYFDLAASIALHINHLIGDLII